MAETAKMLSPDKHVYLANPLAGCPMAEQMDAEMIKAIKAKEPDRKVVCYINTTAALKEVCDVCVTSSSAVKIVKNMDAKKILFIPDCNLGSFVQKACPDKDIKLLQGGCPTHARVTKAELDEAKRLHPNALVLVHPECRPEVTELCDYAGSTSDIMNYAAKSDAKEFIIGTENSIAEHLQYRFPEKEFYVMSKRLICPLMDARRQQAYSGLYRFDETNEFVVKKEQEPEAIKDIIDRINIADEPVTFLGDGVPVFKDYIEKNATVDYDFAPAFCSRQRAGAVASLGKKYFDREFYTSAEEFRPVYLRKSQAEREREEKAGANA